MPVETLRPTDGRLTGGPFTSAMPFRILNKGPDYFRRAPEPGTRKLSAVERLEADKAKYVKSQQVALTRQEPVKPPIIRKPLLSPSMMMQCRINTPPARKITWRLLKTENGGLDHGMSRGPQLNLEVLNNLINVCDGPLASSPTPSSPSPSASSPSSGGQSVGSGQSAEPQHCINFKAHLGSTPNSSRTSSPLINQPSPAEPSRRPPPVPARAPQLVPQGSYGTPNSVTVRRVDVRPQAEIRKPQRLPLQPKPRQAQIAQPQIAQPQAPPTSSAQKQPLAAHPSSSCIPSSSLLLRPGILPPASPAFTRISSASSRGSRPGSTRKHPSLHRSKSDLSDRYSRATADLERFFNYCGLNPDEVEGMGGMERFARANSDIVSVSKLRSVSTPSSECGDGGDGQRGEEEEDDDDGPIKPSERVPYGISVIERNARVIKWLYGIRQARDASQNISNV
ncbi:protein FAM110B-like [Sinocyclocheilus anshuiensis]|uniref:Protein FAM110B-like n=1 Tax=Sinocyclocheilus anshuiensis TaxID=1608454 RepID=A0A671K953_9TELE|nr:PREDICTED: protein FAM110B-like [Sinocyclocheilus anshuiensis]XP_016300493.1 PREDICTED: protein FAM110B-like [Sinocyclocheilus anshuiensis]